MNASEPRVWVFFYGSYMNPDVLKEVDLVPDRFEPARLAGFDIRIGPRANLVPSDRHSVFGVLAQATHAELERLYHQAETILGETYRPEPVLAQTTEGEWRPALCYVCFDMKPRPAESDYIDRIVAPARNFGFPAWYVAKIEEFRP